MIQDIAMEIKFQLANNNNSGSSIKINYVNKIYIEVDNYFN